MVQAARYWLYSNDVGAGFFVRSEDFDKLESLLLDARAHSARLEQAIWDARAIMGFDNDGDPTPAALTHPSLAELCVRDAREFRKDYDESCAETERAEALAAVLEKDARRFRWWFTRGNDADDTSSTIVDLHLRVINNDFPALDEWREAIDAAIDARAAQTTPGDSAPAYLENDPEANPNAML